MTEDKSKLYGDHDKAPTDRKAETKVTTDVPEKAMGQINPSSPADTGTTPGSNAEIG